MSFDFQNLPYLASKEVLSTMKVDEIFKLASLSKKNASKVKPCLNTQRFKLTIFSTDGWKIETSCQSFSAYFSENAREEGVFLDKTVYEVLEFIVYVFNKPIINLRIANDIEVFHNYSRFFESLGVKINKVTFDRCKQGELQNMLKAFKEVPNVKLWSVDLEKGTQFDKTIHYQFDLIEITICEFMDVEWQRDLLFSLIDCKGVVVNKNSHPLGGQSVPTKDLKAFLELWINGSKMEHICTTAFDLSEFPTIFESLGQVIPVKAANRLNGSHKWKLEFREDQCFMIQQKNNGPKAIVWNEYNTVQLETYFELI
uniref:F-box domain-containing protein n=1 Tax=Caenorhabditis tropicalis TaxID=1561998 RepID=A0A1I7TBH7_9PELO